jgi:hypothetical protein
VTIVGVAVYDAATAAVHEIHLRTVHGLAAEQLLWSDDRTLVIGTGQIRGADGTQNESTSYGDRLSVWRLGQDSLRPIALPGRHAGWSQAWAGSGRLVLGSGSRQLFVLPRHPAHPRSVRVPGAVRTPVVLSPDLRTLATVIGQNNPSAVAVGRLLEAQKSPSVAALHRVTHGRNYYLPLGWADADHVAALRELRAHHSPAGSRIDLVDVHTGVTKTVVYTVPGGGNAWGAQSLATDLLAAPSAHASPPPRPWNPRWMLGLAAWGLMCAGLFLWGIRGRRA